MLTCSDSFCCRMLSYSARTFSTLSAHILSAIICICFKVKMGLSSLPVAVPREVPATAMWSISIIGSGELGAEPGDGGPQCDGDPGELGPAPTTPCPANCRRRFSRLISSRKLLAICSGVSGVSRNTEGGGPAFSGVQWGLRTAPPHCLLRFCGLEGECRGSKSRLLLRVTQAITMQRAPVLGS